jgi:hypothetical protein
MFCACYMLLTLHTLLIAILYCLNYFGGMQTFIIQ